MFVFADSPRGGEDARDSGVPEGKAYLLHQASVKEANDPIAQAHWVSSLRHQLEEPDVWSTSPVLWEAWGSNPPCLPDTCPQLRSLAQSVTTTKHTFTGLPRILKVLGSKS